MLLYIPHIVSLNDIRPFFNTAKPKIDAVDLVLDGRYNHTQQVQDRLTFLK